MPRRRRNVAGWMSPRPAEYGPPRKGRPAILFWPFRTGARVVGSIVVAALTAVVVAYVATRQDDVFDALGDLVGDPPLLVQSHPLELEYRMRQLVLPMALPPERAAEIRTAQDYRALLEDADAVALGSSEVELTIEGNRHESVIIERIVARVVSRAGALAGTYLTGLQGGGPEEKIPLTFDLDSRDKRARVPDDDPAPDELFEQHNYVEVRRGEKLMFSLYALTRQAYVYEWVVDLVVQVGGRRTTLTVGADAPYSVSGPVDEYSTYYAVDPYGPLTGISHDEVCPDGCTRKGPEWAYPG